MQLLHIGDEENLVCLLWISDIRTFMACLYIYCFANHMAVWPILVHLHCVVYRYAICVSVCFMDERWSVNYYLFVIMIATFFMILRIFHFYDHLQVFLSSLGWYFALRSLQRCLQIACLHSCCWLPLFFQVDGSDWTSHRHHTFGRSSSLRPSAATATAASPSHILKLLIKWLLFMTLLVVLMLAADSVAFAPFSARAGEVESWLSHLFKHFEDSAFARRAARPDCISSLFVVSYSEWRIRP